jgi:hypothetical protein
VAAPEVLEVFGAPGRAVGRKQRVRPGQRPLAPLLDATGTRELAEREAAEVHRAERRDVARQIGAGGGALGARRGSSIALMRATQSMSSTKRQMSRVAAALAPIASITPTWPSVDPPSNCWWMR